MQINTNTYTAKDGKSIHYYHWSSNHKEKAKGVIQIIHGFGEHAERYEHLASDLIQQNFEVYANDHRGHGRTEEQSRKRGYFEKGNFWEKAIDDIRQLNLQLQKTHPNQPILMLGHSMGSLLTRDYITRYGKELSGVLLSGTVSYRPLIGTLGLFLAQAIQLTYGRNTESRLLKALFFDDFNRKFKPNRTKFDWISRDENEVDAFINDTLRVEDFSVGIFTDVLQGVKKVNRAPIYHQTPKALPLFIFSGDADPAGEMGKGILKIYKAFKKAGHQDITLKLYKGGRHEMLNETNQTEVFNDIKSWIGNLALQNSYGE